jgi:hypothetical protein
MNLILACFTPWGKTSMGKQFDAYNIHMWSLHTSSNTGYKLELLIATQECVCSQYKKIRRWDSAVKRTMTAPFRILTR